MSRYLGCHVSSAGGFESALDRASELGVNAIQLHPSPPQRWNSKPYPVGYETAFNAKREASGVVKVFFHAIYLINLATPDALKFQQAKMSLIYYLDLCHRIGGEGVIVHVGSTVNQPNESEGFKRAAEGIAEVMAATSSLSSKLLLEVAAGGGSTIGDEPEELRTITNMLPDTKRVGYALDTQHLWASGVDIADTEAVVTRLKNCFGDKIYAIHLNDSMTDFGSRKDRHENLGDGKIGLETLGRFINHSFLKDIPVILETPGLGEVVTAKEQVSKLQMLAKA